jgi:hypothetical protein
LDHRQQQPTQDIHPGIVEGKVKDGKQGGADEAKPIARGQGLIWT